MLHQCEFCAASLETDEPENVALLTHLVDSAACQEQFVFMIDNLHASWTISTSGP